MSKAYIQAFKFLLVGCINTVVGLAAIYGLMWWTDISPLAANALGYAIGIIISYTLNKLWTFQNNGSHASSLPRYFICAGICYGANTLVVGSLIYLLNTNSYTAQLGGILTYTALMFISCRIFVFQASPIKYCKQEKN
jgi:putative flippase GtrA